MEAQAGYNGAMKQDDFLRGQIEDRIRQASDSYMMTATAFLDPHERAVAEEAAKAPIGREIRRVFTGGYPDAERVVLLCLPDYVGDPAEAENEVLTVIRASVPAGGRKLRHSDYLGSLMGLGIERSVTGDILVRENGADIIVLKEMAAFLLDNYAKAGRSYLTLEEVPLSALIVPEGTRELHRDTVASLRLDSVAASAFGLSRAKAQEAIRKGLIYLNSVEELRTDRAVEEGDRIVLRGKGKVRLTAVGGRSRKDRLYIEYETYL